MPIELSADEIAERLGTKESSVFKAVIIDMLFQAEQAKDITSRMVKYDNGYVRKYSFTLTNEVAKRSYYSKTEKGWNTK